MTTAAVLAGGLSSRMGYDKKLIKVHDDYLLIEICQKLSTYFDQVIVVSNTPVDCLDALPKTVQVVEDIIGGCGPLGGIHAALSNAIDDHVYVMACDMPNIDLAYVRHLENYTGFDAVVTRFGEWIEPFHAFYHKRLIPDIERYLRKGRRSIFGLLHDKHVGYVPEAQARVFSKDWSLFFNINTKEDLNNESII